MLATSTVSISKGGDLWYLGEKYNRHYYAMVRGPSEGVLFSRSFEKIEDLNFENIDMEFITIDEVPSELLALLGKS